MKKDKTAARLKKTIKPYFATINFIAAFSVAAALLSVGFAYLAKYLVNSVADKNTEKAFIFACCLVAAASLRVVFLSLSKYFSEKTRAKMSVDLRNYAFSRVAGAEYREVRKRHSGELVSVITQDSGEIASDTVALLPAVLSMSVQLFGALAALFVIDWIFGTIIVVGGVFVLALTALSKRKYKTFQSKIMDADAKNRAFMQESISSSVTIKAYGAEEKTVEKSKKVLNDYLENRISRAKFNVGITAVYSVFANLGLVFAIIWCSARAFSSSADYGAILSVVLLMEQLQRPFTSFSSVMPVYYSRYASAERYFGVCDLAQESIGKSVCAADFEKIEVKNVSFSYGEKSALENLSFEVEKGQTVVINGTSGAGKTTLFMLILGIFKPQRGEITVTSGGKENTVNENTRDLFAYVPQKSFAFSGTIYENLTFFGNENAETTEKRINEAIKIACAEFVYDLPEGLRTKLGEQGAGLSEGQLQRLAVARALSSGRPVLLLDEATSALDIGTEEKMLENIRNKNITCIEISHKTKAENFADKTVSIS